MSDLWETRPRCWNCGVHMSKEEVFEAVLSGHCKSCGMPVSIGLEPLSSAMETYLTINCDAEWYKDQSRTPEELAAYLRGLAAGFCVFAWWKDGVQYVGSCGTKLVDAMGTIRSELERLQRAIISAVATFPREER